MFIASINPDLFNSKPVLFTSNVKLVGRCDKFDDKVNMQKKKVMLNIRTFKKNTEYRLNCLAFKQDVHILGRRLKNELHKRYCFAKFLRPLPSLGSHTQAD